MEGSTVDIQDIIHHLNSPDKCPSKLILQNFNINDDTVKIICDSLKINQTLLHLDLKNNNIGNDGAVEIGNALKSNTHLNYLDVSYNFFTYKGSKEIFKGLKVNRSLNYVNLSNNKLQCEGDIPREIFVAFQFNKTLQYLDLSKNNINEITAKIIFEGLAKNISLVELDLSFNNITGLTCHDLLDSCLEQNTTLKSLNLGHNPLSNEFLFSLARSYSKSSINKLDVSSLLHTSSEGLDRLIQCLSEDKVVTDLNISINLIDSQFVNLIKNNTTLKRLNISSTNVNDNDIIQIFELLETNTTLTHLDISSILVTEAVIPGISQFLKVNETLELLNASYIKVGENAQILADGIRKSKALETLKLNGIKNLNRVGKKQIIHAIAANPPIKHYSISGLDLDPDQYGEILKALKANTRLETLTVRSMTPGFTMEQSLLDSFTSIYQSSKNLMTLDLGIQEFEPMLFCKNFEFSNLKAFPETIFQMTHIQSLNLSNNQLSFLPDNISTLTQLKDLDISSNNLLSLPTTMSALTNLKTLKLTNNPFKTPPPEILKSSIKNILGFLKDLETESIPVYKIKIMMVGQENVGKTTLLKLLRRQGHQRRSTVKKIASKQTISTDGIDIDEWQVDITFDDESTNGPSSTTGSTLPTGGKDGSKDSSIRNTMTRTVSYLNPIRSSYEEHSKKAVSISAWDFAGQEIYYTTHQFFLSTRSIYLVTWDLRYDADECKVSYWLQSIRSRTKSSPVIIVGTHSDELSSQEEADAKVKKLQKRFKKNFPFIKATIAVSCKNEVNVQYLFTIIKKLIKEQNHMGELIPKSYIEMDRLIKEELTNINEGRADYPPLRSLNEVRKLGSFCNIKDEDEFKRCLKFLHDTGTLIYFDDPSVKMKDLVIIDPQFLTKVMSTIITTKNNIKDGIIHKHMFPIIWRPPEFPQDIHDMLLHLLENFEIVYTLPTSFRAKIGHKRTHIPKIGLSQEIDIEPIDDIDILVPSILPEQKPEFDLVWIEHDSSKIHYERHYRFEFIPKGFFSRLMIRCLHIVDSVNVYWRNGIIATRDQDMFFLEVIQNESLLKLKVRGPSTSPPTDTLRICSDMINFLIGMNSWFKVIVSVYVPCVHCKKNWVEPSKTTYYSLEQLVDYLSKGEVFIKCHASIDVKNVLIASLIPDLVLIDLERSKIPSSELTFGEEIGKGAFGLIHKGMYKGNEIAIKTMKTGDINQKMLQDFRREAYLMSGMKHPNLVKMLGFCLDPFSIIMEYLPYGNLNRYLKTIPKDCNWPFIMKVALDIARGMYYLHDSSPPFIHRDLKSPNIMMIDVRPDASVCAKIGDFGLSSRMYVPSLQEYTSTRDVGNPTWLAPEIIKEEEFTEKSDIYSYAIILWELCTKEHPFSEFKHEFMFELENTIKNGIRPTIPSNIPESFSNLIKQCWDDNPLNRPSFFEIIKSLITISAELAPDLLIPEDIFSNDYSNDDEDSIDSGNESSVALDIKDEGHFSSGQLLKKITTKPMRKIYSLCKVDDNVWTGTKDGSILIWNEKNGHLLASHLNIHQSEISYIFTIHDFVWTASRDEKCYVWKSIDPSIARETAIKNEQISLKQGIVYRKVGLISKLKKRLLCIRGRKLILLKVDSSKSFFSFDLESIQIVPETNPKKFGFQINSNGKSIQIICKDKEDQNGWINEINEQSIKPDELYKIELIKEIPMKDIKCLTIVEDEEIWGGTSDMQIKIWNVMTYDLVQTFEISLLEFSNEDNLSISCIHYFNEIIWLGILNYLVLFDKATSTPLQVIEAHTQTITKIIGYDSKIWTLSDDKTVKVWDAKSLLCLKTFKDVISRPISIVQKNSQMWISGWDGDITIINTSNLTIEKQIIEQHSDVIQDLCVSGVTVWAGGWDGVLSIWK